MRNTIQGYKPFDGVYNKVTTTGGNLNFKTDWRGASSSIPLFYNRSVIELTKLGYNIRYNKVNHAKQVYVICLSNGSKLIKAEIALACITDESKVKKRTRIKTKKAVCYIDKAVIESKILITKPKTNKIML